MPTFPTGGIPLLVWRHMTSALCAIKFPKAGQSRLTRTTIARLCMSSTIASFGFPGGRLVWALFLRRCAAATRVLRTQLCACTTSHEASALKSYYGNRGAQQALRSRFHSQQAPPLAWMSPRKMRRRSPWDRCYGHLHAVDLAMCAARIICRSRSAPPRSSTSSGSEIRRVSPPGGLAETRFCNPEFAQSRHILYLPAHAIANSWRVLYLLLSSLLRCGNTPKPMPPRQKHIDIRVLVRMAKYKHLTPSPRIASTTLKRLGTLRDLQHDGVKRIPIGVLALLDNG